MFMWYTYLKIMDYEENCIVLQHIIRPESNEIYLRNLNALCGKKPK